VRSVFMRLLATTAVAGMAATLQMTGRGSPASSTSAVTIPLAALQVPVHGGSGLFLRDQVPQPRPQFAGVDGSLVQLRRTDGEQPGAEP
jgi:hypothetical protein